MNKTILFGALLLAGCASGGTGDAESSPAESDARESLPTLANRAFFERLMEREYPPELRMAGVGGDVVVWVTLDAEGVVQEASVKDGSGYARLDETAVRIARRMRFSPARYDGKPVGVKIAFTVTFRAGDGWT